MVQLKLEELSLVLLVCHFYWVTSEPRNKLAPFTATPQVSIQVLGGRPIVDFSSSSRLEAKRDNLENHLGCSSSSKNNSSSSSDQTSSSSSLTLNNQSSSSMGHLWLPSFYNSLIPPPGFGDAISINVEMEMMELAMPTTDKIEMVARLILSWSDSRLLEGNISGEVQEVPKGSVWQPYVEISWWGNTKTTLFLLKNSTLLLIHSLQLYHRCIDDVSMLPNDQHSCHLTISIPNTPRSAAQLQWGAAKPPPTDLPYLLIATPRLTSDNNHPGSTPQIHLQLDITRDFESFLFLTLIPSHVLLAFSFLSWVSASSPKKVHFLHLLCFLLTLWHCCLRLSLDLITPTMLDAWVAICLLLMLLASFHSLYSTQSRPSMTSSRRVLPTHRPKAGPSMYGGLQEEEHHPNVQDGMLRPSCCVVGAWLVMGFVSFVIWLVVTFKWNWRRPMEDSIF